MQDFAIFPFYQLPFCGWLQIAEIATDTVISQNFNCFAIPDFCQFSWQYNENKQVDWLIAHFNQWFHHYDTILVRGEHEPEYFAKTADSPAKIVFAHGFFASCLHEISHWCVAGKKRRLLNDFGYWYAPDGRSESQQREFEQVEIVPQAIECLLTLSCGKKFRVSQDNLFADFDTSQSTFADDVKRQAMHFWQTGEKLPNDAKTLILHLKKLRPIALSLGEIERNFA